jgi:hypothetical protein
VSPLSKIDAISKPDPVRLRRSVRTRAAVRYIARMALAFGALLSASGVLVAAVAFYNRDKPEWQRGMRTIYFLAFAQVALGTVTVLLGR